MSFAPFAAIWVVLVAAVVVCLFAGSHPRIVMAITLIMPLLTIVVWSFFRPDGISGAVSFAGWQWSVGETSWQLTGIALWLLLAAAAQTIANRERLRLNQQSAWLFGMASAALPVVWAADDRTRVMAITIFVVAWTAAFHLNRLPEEPPVVDGIHPAFRLFVALFPLWLAAAWPAARMPLSLLATAILLGVWPFGSWRLPARTNAVALLSHGLPIIVGAAVLAAATITDIPAATDVALATALGLLSLIIGLIRAWERSPGKLAEALGLGLAGLALAAGIWAGREALIAAVRLTVFAPALLLIGLVPTRLPVIAPKAETLAGRFQISPRQIPLALVFLALAGLPLTVGFSVLSPLYRAWFAAGGWLLLLVTVLLLALWLLVVYLAGRLGGVKTAVDRSAWPSGVVLAIPALGLLHFNTAALHVESLIWAAIIIPPVAALLLGSFAHNLDSLGELLREAVMIPQVVGQIQPYLRRTGRLIDEALNDALAILEGEYGLLWLLGLLILLLWIA